MSSIVPGRGCSRPSRRSCRGGPPGRDTCPRKRRKACRAACPPPHFEALEAPSTRRSSPAPSHSPRLSCSIVYRLLGSRPMIRFGLRCGGIRIPGRLRAAAIEASKLLEDLSIVASPGQATGLPQEIPRELFGTPPYRKRSARLDFRHPRVSVTPNLYCVLSYPVRSIAGCETEKRGECHALLVRGPDAAISPPAVHLHPPSRA